MDDEYNVLTNKTKMLLLKLYQLYQDRVADGMPRDKAINTGHLTVFKPLALPDYSDEDVIWFTRELARHGFLTICEASNTIYNSWLTTEAISRMQNRFKNGVKIAIDTLAKFM